MKNNINKHITAISQSVYIDKSGDIVNKDNNTYHRTVKMKPIDININAYSDIDVESNDKDTKFKVGDKQ